MADVVVFSSTFLLTVVAPASPSPSVGVPPGDERKIFESFYRAHDALGSGIPGSGLGLTLAQQLAREHGGEILYQPRPDGGSNFTLRVPLTPSNS